MNNSDDTILTAAISGEELNDRELDELARNLLEEISSSIRVSSVAMGVSEAPDGTRSGAGIQLGTVVVALLPVLLNQSIELIKSWAKRNANAKVTLTISAPKDKHTTITITDKNETIIESTLQKQGTSERSKG